MVRPPTPIESTRMIAVDRLTPHPDNPRRGNIEEIRQSLTRFGQYRAIIVQKSTMHICAGNHTYLAARAEGWTQILASIIDVDDDTARAILLADNRLADLGAYEPVSLAEVLGMVQNTTGLAGTGYTTEDLETMLARLDRKPEEDRTPKIEITDHDVRAGQVWKLGRHRLIIGDATKTTIHERLLGSRVAHLVVTSPPYAEQRDYDPESGFEPIKPDEYVDWWEPIQANIAAHLAPDGSMLINLKPPGRDLDTDLYVFDLVVAHVRRWGWHFATELTWERNGVPKAPTLRFKNQFEPIYQFTRGRWKFRPDHVRHYSPNVPIAGGEGAGDTGWRNTQGHGGRAGSISFGGGPTPGAELDPEDAGRLGWRDPGTKKRRTGTAETISSVQGIESHDAGLYTKEGLAYPGNRLPTYAGSHEIVGHPAAFPVGLARFLIEAYTDPRDHVLDPFTGSGSTILAAEETGRTGFGIEISPVYANQALSRWDHHHPDRKSTPTK